MWKFCNHCRRRVHTCCYCMYICNALCMRSTEARPSKVSIQCLHSCKCHHQWGPPSTPDHTCALHCSGTPSCGIRTELNYLSDVTCTHLSHWFLISVHKGHYKVKLYMQICFRPLMLPFSSSVLQCCSCVNCQRESFIPSCVGESGTALCIPQCHRAHEVSGWSDVIDHSLFDM